MTERQTGGTMQIIRKIIAAIIEAERKAQIEARRKAIAIELTGGTY